MTIEYVDNKSLPLKHDIVIDEVNAKQHRLINIHNSLTLDMDRGKWTVKSRREERSRENIRY